MLVNLVLSSPAIRCTFPVKLGEREDVEHLCRRLYANAIARVTGPGDTVGDLITRGPLEPGARYFVYPVVRDHTETVLMDYFDTLNRDPRTVLQR